jgi:hypothetical protein
MLVSEITFSFIVNVNKLAIVIVQYATLAFIFSCHRHCASCAYSLTLLVLESYHHCHIREKDVQMGPKGGGGGLS